MRNRIQSNRVLSYLRAGGRVPVLPAALSHSHSVDNPVSVRQGWLQVYSSMWIYQPSSVSAFWRGVSRLAAITIETATTMLAWMGASQRSVVS